MKNAPQPIVSELSSTDMLDLVQEFVGELPARAQAVCQAFAHRDLEQIARLAHQLKGAAGGYGFAPISAVAGALEKSVREQACLDDIQRQVQELADICGRAQA